MSETNQENESAQEPQAESTKTEAQQSDAQTLAGKVADSVKEDVVQKEVVAQKDEPVPASQAESPPNVQAVEQAAVEKPKANKQAAKNKAARQQKRPSSSQKRKRPRRKNKKALKEYDTVVAHFAACGRCSYFLAGYRALHGVQNLETAVIQSPVNKLNLTWNFDMRDLLTKSYGVTFSIDHLHLEAICPECSRQYGYSAGDDNKKDSFHIEMSRGRK